MTSHPNHTDDSHKSQHVDKKRKTSASTSTTWGSSVYPAVGHRTSQLNVIFSAALCQYISADNGQQYTALYRSFIGQTPRFPPPCSPGERFPTVDELTDDMKSMLFEKKLIRFGYIPDPLYVHPVGTPQQFMRAMLIQAGRPSGDTTTATSSKTTDSKDDDSHHHTTTSSTPTEQLTGLDWALGEAVAAVIGAHYSTALATQWVNATPTAPPPQAYFVRRPSFARIVGQGGHGQGGGGPHFHVPTAVTSNAETKQFGETGTSSDDGAPIGSPGYTLTAYSNGLKAGKFDIALGGQFVLPIAQTPHGLSFEYMMATETLFTAITYTGMDQWAFDNTKLAALKGGDRQAMVDYLVDVSKASSLQLRIFSVVNPGPSPLAARKMAQDIITGGGQAIWIWGSVPDAYRVIMDATCHVVVGDSLESGFQTTLPGFKGMYMDIPANGPAELWPIAGLTLPGASPIVTNSSSTSSSSSSNTLQVPSSSD